MSLYEKIVSKQEKLALVGLGYVGMPIAVAFAKKVNVIGFDLNSEKINLYKQGVDPTKEVGNDAIKATTVEFTYDETKLREAKFIIVAVPTPVNTDHTPDLTPVIGASEIVGRNLTKDSIVVYESTVYPGCTEDVCIPILEKESGLKCGEDFKVGYSPERINPGDKVHRLENIHKIVAGMDDESREEIKNIYNLVIEVGTYPVSNIKTAEAVKVVENSQRDINIAFMNELAMVFDRMGIDTNEVVDGMNTKWNALGFRPGLVGGHCIGVDPYYFTYEAEKLGYHSQIILNGRIVNDSMGAYVADAAIKQMIEASQAPKNSKVVILGLTFKENCPDTRNSKVNDIIKRLKTYGIAPVVVDPWASERDAMHEYGVTLTKLEVEDEQNQHGVDDVAVVLQAAQCLRQRAQDERTQRGAGQAVDAAEEDHDDPVGALLPAEAGGVDVGHVEGIQHAGVARQRDAEQEGDHLDAGHVDAHGLGGQLVTLQGDALAAVFAGLEEGSQRDGDDSGDRGHRQADQTGDAGQAGGTAGQGRHAVQQGGDGLAEAQRNQRDIVAAQADDGVADEVTDGGRTGDSQNGGQHEGNMCADDQQTGHIGADRHEGRLTKAEHAGQTRQDVNARDGDQGNKYLRKNVGYKCIHLFYILLTLFPERCCPRCPADEPAGRRA